jgi:hypothetical protein
MLCSCLDWNWIGIGIGIGIEIGSEPGSEAEHASFRSCLEVEVT